MMWSRFWRRLGAPQAPVVLAVALLFLLTIVGPAAVLTSPDIVAELMDEPVAAGAPSPQAAAPPGPTAAELASCQSDSELPRVERQPLPNAAAGQLIRLVTADHEAVIAYHAALSAKGAVLWLSGADGGLDGPFEGFYERLATRLQDRGLASVRLEYHKPGDLDLSVRDALLALRFLAEEGQCNVGVVGFSFGGAVAIETAAMRPHVRVVATLASQGLGTDRVHEIAPRPLLIVYPVGDELIAPDMGSEDIFDRAGEPKELVQLASKDHYLEDVAPDVEGLVAHWLQTRLTAGPSPAAAR